jgi:hypothetical protein
MVRPGSGGRHRRGGDVAGESAGYSDRRSAEWRSHHEAALSYEDYLATSAEKAQRWRRIAAEIPPLTDAQIRRLDGHGRRLNVLFYSGIWCGDCVRQGPMVLRIAEACGSMVRLRFAERDSSEWLREELRVLGGLRVPVAVFLSEDYFEIARFGDRTLASYRAKALREVGAACSSGIVSPPLEELAAEMGEWVNLFERALLMLRLAPQLRSRYSD